MTSRRIAHTHYDVKFERRSQPSLFSPHKILDEDDRYLSEQLITYIGNKRKLLPMIGTALTNAADTLGKKEISFADVFAGTGIVSRFARRWAHTLHINDFEDYSSFTNRVYHTNASSVDNDEIRRAAVHVNKLATSAPRAGFITELYAPADEANIQKSDRVFYTRRNAMFIDTARVEIDALPEKIQPFVLAPLLQRASVHVNTSGVFKGFYKNADGIGQFGGTMRNALQRICAPIEIPVPIFSNFDRDVIVKKLDAEAFVKTLPPVDVAYFDPPYNQHPYGSNYFMLNLILQNKPPNDYSAVSGIPKDWQRSDFNVRAKAADALNRVLTACPAKILIISYNSEGFVGFDEMMDMLEKLGNVEVFDQSYNTFRGCRNLAGRSTHVTEFLFKVERKM